MNIMGLAIYGIVVLACYIYAYLKNKQKYKKSLKQGGKQFLKQVPFLIAIFLFISLFDVFVPKRVIISIIGKGNGAMSVLLSAILGGIIQGPVASSYPLGQLLLEKGATVTSVATFLNSWVMVGILILPFEISVFGKKFAYIRNLISFIGAILIGIAVGYFMVIL